MKEKRKEYLKKYHKEYSDNRKRINISLSDTEYKLLEYLSKREGLKPTSFVAELVKVQLQKNPYISTDIALELKRLRLLIKNVSNNINQIARHSNTVKYVINENDVFKNLQKLEQNIIEFTSNKVNE